MGFELIINGGLRLTFAALGPRRIHIQTKERVCVYVCVVLRV